MILTFLFSAWVCQAECYNEDTCYKDYITIMGKDMAIAVNRDTGKVQLYWSEKDKTWIKPTEEYQSDLQKIYNKKLRLMEMQSHLDSMRRWYTTDESGSLRR